MAVATVGCECRSSKKPAMWTGSEERPPFVVYDTLCGALMSILIRRAIHSLKESSKIWR